MTEIKFNGGFNLPKGLDPNRFMTELSAFLSKKKVVLSGTLQIIDFEDAEIIEETCTNVEQTEVIDPAKTAEDIQQ
jgi:hypothetical protein